MKKLVNKEYVAGNEYTIADMAHFGGMWRSAFAGIDVADHPNVKRWYDQVASCPEVKVALSKIKALVPSTT